MLLLDVVQPSAIPIERYSVCVIVSPICVCLVVRMHHGKCNKRESIDETIRLKARAHSGNYLQIKIPLCTPKYSPLRPLSSATVAADSGVGGGSDGGSSNTRSSSSNSSSNNEDEAVIGVDLLSAAPLQYPGCTTDRIFLSILHLYYTWICTFRIITSPVQESSDILAYHSLASVIMSAYADTTRRITFSETAARLCISHEACCSKKYPVRPTTKNQDYVVSCPEIDGLSILRTEPIIGKDRIALTYRKQLMNEASTMIVGKSKRVYYRVEPAVTNRLERSSLKIQRDDDLNDPSDL
ncbi:hypothetical protein V1477_009438 [Vespula maculifrons]|uniref:Uncharacterized protein n=1 Tax=Vespula maculifrons TaxID=7453 RepID=A0ABD2CAN3_VESMC